MTDIVVIRVQCISSAKNSYSFEGKMGDLKQSLIIFEKFNVKSLPLPPIPSLTLNPLNLKYKFSFVASFVKISCKLISQ